jgi:hypothetical protein
VDGLVDTDEEKEVGKSPPLNFINFVVFIVVVFFP